MTAANVADGTVLPELLQDLTNKRYRYKNRIDDVQWAKNRNKSRVRSKVEHVFGVINRRDRNSPRPTCGPDRLTNRAQKPTNAGHRFAPATCSELP